MLFTMGNLIRIRASNNLPEIVKSYKIEISLKNLILIYLIKTHEPRGLQFGQRCYIARIFNLSITKCFLYLYFLQITINTEFDSNFFVLFYYNHMMVK